MLSAMVTDNMYKAKLLNALIPISEINEAIKENTPKGARCMIHSVIFKIQVLKD